MTLTSSCNFKSVMVIVIVKASEGSEVTTWPLSAQTIITRYATLPVKRPFNLQTGWLPTKWPSSGGIAPTFEIGSLLLVGLLLLVADAAATQRALKKIT